MTAKTELPCVILSFVSWFSRLWNLLAGDVFSSSPISSPWDLYKLSLFFLNTHNLIAFRRWPSYRVLHGKGCWSTLKVFHFPCLVQVILFFAISNPSPVITLLSFTTPVYHKMYSRRLKVPILLQFPPFPKVFLVFLEVNDTMFQQAFLKLFSSIQLS